MTRGPFYQKLPVTDRSWMLNLPGRGFPLFLFFFFPPFSLRMGQARRMESPIPCRGVPGQASVPWPGWGQGQGMPGASIAPGAPQGAFAQPQLWFHLYQITDKRWLKRREGGRPRPGSGFMADFRCLSAADRPYQVGGLVAAPRQRLWELAADG